MSEKKSEETLSVKKVRPRKGKVISAKQETSDTWTLSVRVAKEERQYLAGQFVSIDPHQFAVLSEMVSYLEHKKGRKEQVRAYSLASAPHEDLLLITTKPERFYPDEMDYPPLLSPLLASDFLVGRTLNFLGYTGAYVLPAEHSKSTNEVFHFVAGSGVVPNFALLKDELTQKKNRNVIHTMVNVNKTYQDIIYRDELEDLRSKFPERFKLFHYLTRESSVERYGPHFRLGRPGLKDVKPLIHDPEKVLLFSCGSAVNKWQRQRAKASGVDPKPKFLEHVTEIAKTLGIDRKRFKKEVYG